MLKNEPHGWFNPRYRRVLTVAFCAIWTALELWYEPGSIWTMLMLGVTVYAAYDFFYSGKYP